eukprot:CAMPEP_0179007500 /NCGR_PEP_ID=MMETSP0795-20121207/15195_1 /TAXON_ID=88552 /ORGANISM="Amoebophrya sp., Strain Ameob2" /LENGTH=183 /DNA_ID=CAMNT_0020702481 /DNA_START=48 /DNA_END=597 /DNA_ORIENTATION=-
MTGRNITLPENKIENLKLDPDLRLQHEGVGFRMKHTVNDIDVDAAAAGLYHFDELRDPSLQPINTLQDDARESILQKSEEESNADFLVRSQLWQMSRHLQVLYGDNYVDRLETEETNMTANWTRDTRYPLTRLYTTWSNLTNYQCPPATIADNKFLDHFGNQLIYGADSKSHFTLGDPDSRFT